MIYDQRPIKSHRDLIVWQRAMQVRREVRLVLLSLPRQDRFEIGGQVARAALSIPANIAEGHGRLARADYKQFLSFSRGSIGELDTQLLGIAEDHPTMEPHVRSTLGTLEEVSRMVTSIIGKL
jgi:four helix bundle protein